MLVTPEKKNPIKSQHTTKNNPLHLLIITVIYPFQVLSDHKQQSPSLKKKHFLCYEKKKFPMQPETFIIVFTTARFLSLSSAK